MAGTKNPPRTRKRVDADPDAQKRTKDSSKAAAVKKQKVEAEANALKRAKDGSAFTKCEECKKDVPVVLIDMHNCSLESKIKMKMESMVVEKAVEAKKPSEKKKVSKSEPKSKSETKSKRIKKSSDPNMPKRPPTAFFLFMSEFRKEYNKEHPDNKSVAVVGKEAGEKWKTMPEEEKKVYLERAAKLKEKYEEEVKKLKSEKEVVEVEEEGAESDKEDAAEAEEEEGAEEEGEGSEKEE